jgi:ABC-type multidrug transport system ATPase subunit
MPRLKIEFDDEPSEVPPPPGAPPPLAPITPVDVGTVRGHAAGLVIGREPGTCAVVLDHPTVSRRHAAIRREGDRDVLVDLSSAAGVRVNGRIVGGSVALAPNDEIAIGPFRLVYGGGELLHRQTSKGMAITTHAVTVEAGGQRILQPTSVELAGGELVAIIGESGAGKSTLLKVMSGVAAPGSGSVTAGGEDLAAQATDIGYVPQFDIVHGALTVREALEFAARLRLPQDTSANERTTRIAAVLEQLGLTERADVRVDRLSGGQRKRVAVGVELLHSPRALFLDEPTTGLDPGLERRLTALLRSLADEGQTVAYVTHATASIEICDRVLVMGRGGVLCFDGPPAAVLEFFGVERFDDVYAELDRHEPDELARRFRPDSPPAAPPAAAFPLKSLRLLRQSFGYQVSVLTTRDATLLVRDRRHLRSMIVQVPVLAVLTALLFGHDVFRRADGAEGVELFAGKAAQLVFLMVTIAIWMGSINAARQIVKERSVLARELAIGVRPEAYIVSKLLVLFSVTTVQTVAFAAVVLFLRPLHGGLSQAQHLVLVLVLAGWVAVLLGLVVSAHASSEDQATGVIPLLLVPQLLFGGAIVSLQDMTGFMGVIATLVPARWAFSAAGHAIELPDRIAEDVAFSQVSRYGSGFFDVPLPLYVLIAIVFAAVLLTALHRLLLRPVDL